MRALRNAIVALASATAVSGAVYGLIVRPRNRRWGATDEEVRRALTGDELESPYGYRPISTRAITIDAPPDDCLLYTSPSPRDRTRSRMPSSA